MWPKFIEPVRRAVRELWSSLETRMSARDIHVLLNKTTHTHHLTKMLCLELLWPQMNPASFWSRHVMRMGVPADRALTVARRKEMSECECGKGTHGWFLVVVLKDAQKAT